MSDTPHLHPDFFLTNFARQLTANYHRLDKQFVGGCVFFTIQDGDEVAVRTVVFDAQRPRLFSGYYAPTETQPEVPFLHLRLSLAQMAAFFSGTLDTSSSDVSFEGNSQAFYEAVGRCL